MSMSTGRTCNTQEHGHAAKLLIWMLHLDLVPCCPKKVKVILKWLDEIENWESVGMESVSLQYCGDLWWYLFDFVIILGSFNSKTMTDDGDLCGFEMVHSSASFSRGQLHPRAMCYDCSQFCVLDLAADSTKATCHWQESCDACVGRVPFLTRGENIIKQQD